MKGHWLSLFTNPDFKIKKPVNLTGFFILKYLNSQVNPLIIKISDLLFAAEFDGVGAGAIRGGHTGDIYHHVAVHQMTVLGKNLPEISNEVIG